MPTITTAQAGPWGTGSTWVGGVPPDNGDLAVIAHAVTVGDHRICGDSPAAAAGGYALDILEGGSVEITANGRLTVRGDAMMRYGAVAAVGIEVSGGIFEFDSTLAPTPATDGYDFIATDSSGSLRRLEATAGARIRSVAGAANGRFAAGNGNDWSIIATGATGNPVRFERLGRSGNHPAINLLSGGNSWPGQMMVEMTDCVFAECWRLQSGVGAAHPFELLRVSHYDSPDTTALHLSVATPNSPYLHYLQDCTFDKEVYFSICPGLSVRGCTLAGGWNVAGLPLAEWSGNLATMADYGIIPAAQITDDYWWTPRSHGNIKANVSSIDTGPCTITGFTIECTNDAVATDGEFFAGMSPVMDITVNECLLIPSHTGHTLRVAEWLNDNTTRITFNHLTAGLIATGSLGLGHVGDTGIRTDRATLRNSLLIDFHDTTGLGEKTGWISYDNTDGFIASELDYNCGWGCKDSRYPGTTAKGYLHKQSNTADVPGVHDIDVDPWPDRSTTPSVRRAAMRRLKTWGSTVLGLTGTTAEIEDAAIRAIVVRHDPTATGFVSADATPEALRTWVRDPDGFWGPTNPLLETAADDNTQIGAIAFSGQPAGTTVTITPAQPDMPVSSAMILDAFLSGVPSTAVTWSIESGNGSIDANGVLVAPALAGDVVVRATNNANPTYYAEVTIPVNANPVPELGSTGPFRASDPSYDPADYITPAVGDRPLSSARDDAPDHLYMRPSRRRPLSPYSDDVMDFFRSDPLGQLYGMRGTSFDFQYGEYGMPFCVSDSTTQPMVPLTFAGNVPSEVDAWHSDPGPHPIPDDCRVQAYPYPYPPTTSDDNDGHIFLMDRATGRLTEAYKIYKDPVVGWKAHNGWTYEADSGYWAPQVTDSTDPRYVLPGNHRFPYPLVNAAGVKMMPLAVRYEEVYVHGVIRHAIAFTMRNEKVGGCWVWPALGMAYMNRNRWHHNWGPTLRYGDTIRITEAWYRANVEEWDGTPIGTWGPGCRVVLRALYDYGMVMSDGGWPGDMWTVADSRYHEESRYHTDLIALNNISLGVFELVGAESDLITYTVDPPMADESVERTITMSYDGFNRFAQHHPGYPDVRNWTDDDGQPIFDDNGKFYFVNESYAVLDWQGAPLLDGEGAPITTDANHTVRQWAYSMRMSNQVYGVGFGSGDNGEWSWYTPANPDAVFTYTPNKENIRFFPDCIPPGMTHDYHANGPFIIPTSTTPASVTFDPSTAVVEQGGTVPLDVTVLGCGDTAVWYDAVQGEGTFNGTDFIADGKAGETVMRGRLGADLRVEGFATITVTSTETPPELGGGRHRRRLLLHVIRSRG
jgi:hypothetical protein